MSTIRILPFGNMVQAVETDGSTKTLTTAVFPTKGEAQQWAIQRVEALERMDKP